MDERFHLGEGEAFEANAPPPADLKAFAQRLLDGDEDAWDEFQSRWGPWLKWIASGYLIGLERWYSPEDLVQEFLANKIWPNRESFFQGVAHGERMGFSALLDTSLRNYALDIRARFEKERQGRIFPLAADDDESGEAARRLLEGWVEEKDDDEAGGFARLAERYRRLLPKIHEVLSNERLAHYLAVLLAERVHLFKKLRTISEMTVDEAAALAEELVAWPADAGQSSFRPDGPTLDEAWSAIAEGGGTAERGELAKHIGVEHNTFDQWVSRGRSTMKKHWGEDAARGVAPHWFRKKKE